ncbi:MAG: DUF86 domain-containing protein [bacterium]
MKKDPKIFLEHILESIKEINKHIEKISKDKFLKDIKTQDAVIRRIAIIGEAVKKLPYDFKKNHLEINWREISGMRDMLIHEYFGINLSIVWKTVKQDISKLEKQISTLLESL